MAVKFDYSKLKGRIVEKCGSQKVFAAKVGMSEATMVAKMAGTTYFNQKEIIKAIEILDIQRGEVSEYFFTVRV